MGTDSRFGARKLCKPHVKDSLPVILLIGASGQVGREILKKTGKSELDAEVVPASRSSSDPTLRIELERPDSIERLIQETRPRHVILAGAATNVSWCESHPDESLIINFHGPETVATAALRAGATLTFISTDYVFDGADGPYGETDRTNPVNVYGAHKLAAEEAVLAAAPANLVVRTCQIFGDDPRRVNYVMRVVDQIRGGRIVEAPNDLYGTPTFAPDLARQVLQLTLDEAKGVWHVAGDTFLSRYELAEMAAAAFRCDEGMILQVTADHMNDPVSRPKRAGLRNDRLAMARLHHRMTPLRKALATLAAADRDQ